MTGTTRIERLEAQKRTLMRAVAALLATSVALAIGVALLWRGRDANPEVVLPHRETGFSDKEIFTPVADPGLDFTFYPGLKDEPTWRTQVPLTTNWAGLREPRQLNPKPNDVFRIVLLGDSMVAAQAARYEDGVAPQLERFLQTHMQRPEGVQRVEVRPVAVPGWNMFSAVRYAIHNLHVLAPDLCVLLLNRNDMDSGSGFVIGHTLVSVYDQQRLRSTSHASLATPSQFLRGKTDAWGLVASDLIPESRRRFELAAQEIDRLTGLLRARKAPFFVYLYDDYLAPGLDRTLPATIERTDVVLGPTEVTDNNLLPLDGHPNATGHRVLAHVLAAHAARRGYLQLDTVPDTPTFTTLANAGLGEQNARATFAVDRIPSSFELIDGEMVPAAGVRCVVGGCYATGVLSPHSVFALLGDARITHVRIVIEFPDIPALQGGTMTISLGGVQAGTIPMRGEQAVEFDIPAKAERTDLIEVRLDADRYYTNPQQGLTDGVWQAAPQAGRLRSLKLVSH